MRALDLQRIALAGSMLIRSARPDAQWLGARYDRLLIHLDVDVLSYTDFPIAENVRCDGLNVEALSAALAPLLQPRTGAR